MITLVIRGDPQTQGSKTAVTYRTKDGQTRAKLLEGRRAKGRKAFYDWREAIEDGTAAAMDGRPPLTGPVVAAVTFTRKRPAGLPKRRRVLGKLVEYLAVPWQKPDLDKYLRALLDGLVAGGALTDDAQVFELTRFAKHYPVETEHVMTEHPLGGELTAQDVMLRLVGTFDDVLTEPGVVVRLAALSEFGVVTDGEVPDSD